MKKLAIYAAIVSMSSTVLAGDYAAVSFDPSVKNANTKQVTSRGVGVTLGTTVDMWDFSGKFNSAYAVGSASANDITMSGEFRAQANLGPFYARGGLGRMFPDANRDSYSFYTYGGGAQTAIAQGVTVFGEAERNNALKAGNAHFTTYTAGVKYAVSKQDQVIASYVRKLGDVDTGGVQLGYTRSF